MKDLLYVDIARRERVQFDESPTRLDIVAHECRENLVCSNRVFDLDP
jgi:hypothetical protein